jgi:hypothetical protein
MSRFLSLLVLIVLGTPLMFGLPETVSTVASPRGTPTVATHADTLSPGLRSALSAFETDLTRRAVDLSSLRPGGPPKDGIPSIDDPRFVSPEAAANWIAPQEPVLLVSHEGDARGYPLQILIFHEIVNDIIGGTPVAVTFCPLCYSAIAFDRRVEGEAVEFGVSGLLRMSDLVMYDRKTESLWQQFTGRAIVGTLTGTQLDRLPAQIVSFQAFRETYPDAQVLSRETGFDRPYGRNPYAGYEDVDTPPFAVSNATDGRLPPMSKVIAIPDENDPLAIPHAVSRSRGVIETTVGKRSVVIFHSGSTVSVMDARDIRESGIDGTVGVFEPVIGDRRLSFEQTGDGHIVDRETGTRWSTTGRGLDGPLSGRQLPRVEHGSYFAFAWLSFRPSTRILK